MKPRNLQTQKWKGMRTALLRLAIPVVLATASFAVTPTQLFNQGPGDAREDCPRHRSQPSE